MTIFRYKNCHIGRVFEYGATRSGDMLKRMAQRRYAQTDGTSGFSDQIGLATGLIDVLTVDEGVSRIGSVFEYGATPSGDMLKRMAQRRYAQTDGTSGFSASNRSSCPLDRRSDCR